MARLDAVGAWRYPVKSMQGERLTGVRLTSAGLEGDRAFAVRDLGTGRALTGRRAPLLLMASARWVDGEVEMTLPSGQVVRSDHCGAAAALSQWLGLDVDLVRDGLGAPSQYVLPVPEEVTSIYGVAEAGDVVARLGSGLKDVAPIHVLPTSELDGHDLRRFRPNFLVNGEAPADGEEFDLAGARLRRIKPTIRCVMPTRAQPGLEAAPGLLRELAQRTGARLGFYADVIEDAEIAIPPEASAQVDLREAFGSGGAAPAGAQRGG